MKPPVHVTVQMATVGTPVEVSTSCVIDSHCLLLFIGYGLVLNHISMRLQFILHLAKRL